MLVRLTRMLGPSLSKLSTIETGGYVEALAAAIGELGININTDDFQWICEIFGNNTDLEQDPKLIRLNKANQDNHFAGRYGTMFRWLAACVEVNFRDFFDMWSNLVERFESDKSSEKSEQRDQELQGVQSYPKE
jgi:hypothetical protein